MTYREIIYACLDLSKNLSDDITINEEHVMFLVDKYRAALLAQKYKNIKVDVLESNYQTLCLDLEKFSPTSLCNSPIYLRTVSIPKLMEIGNTEIYTNDFYQSLNICIVDRERMKFVGDNPFTKNIIFGSINADGRLYLKSSNPQFLYLTGIKITGVFENPIKASEFECDRECDPMDITFPLEEALITTLINAVVKEIVGAEWRPADERNNANDDLSDMATFIKNNTKSSLQKQIEA